MFPPFQFKIWGLNYPSRGAGGARKDCVNKIFFWYWNLWYVNLLWAMCRKKIVYRKYHIPFLPEPRTLATNANPRSWIFKRYKQWWGYWGFKRFWHRKSKLVHTLFSYLAFECLILSFASPRSDLHSKSYWHVAVITICMLRFRKNRFWWRNKRWPTPRSPRDIWFRSMTARRGLLKTAWRVWMWWFFLNYWWWHYYRYRGPQYSGNLHPLHMRSRRKRRKKFSPPTGLYVEKEGQMHKEDERHVVETATAYLIEKKRILNEKNEKERTKTTHRGRG